MKAKTKSKVVSSLIWKIMELGGIHGIQFIVSLIITRLLDPENYGIIALTSIFITISTVFVQVGLGTALVQKKEVDEIDISSVFYLSLLTAAIFYVILFLSAPYIALYFDIPRLSVVLRVTAITLFPGALNSVQNAVVARRMVFKKQFFSSMGAVIFSGSLGIAMAYLNYGEWALVAQQLSYQTVICIILWFTVKWRPILKFSYKKTAGLLKYGIKIFGAKLIDTIYRNLESFVIGKKYSSEMLAYYNRGKQFPWVIIDNIDCSIQSVMLPAFSVKQENINEVKNMVRKTISMSTYLVFPAMIGLAAIGKPLIRCLLGTKWISSVPFLQIYCLTSALIPLQTANLQAINAIGRSDVYFRLMTVKRIIGVLVLCIAVFCFKDVIAIAISCIVIEMVGVIINIHPNKVLLNYGITEQIKDTVPNLCMAVFMGAIVYSLSYLNFSDIMTIMLQIACGMIIYIGLSKLLKHESFKYLISNISAYLQKEG